MESTLCFSQRLQSALADGLSRAAGRVVPPSDIHMPARAAAAGSPAAIRLGLDAARLTDELSEALPFPEMFGVQPVARVRAENRWLLFDLSDLFKIFGDTTRIKILFSLFESEMCVCAIAELLGMTQSAISHQLKTLKNANLVGNRREGKTIYYFLSDDHVRTIIAQGFEHLLEERSAK